MVIVATKQLGIKDNMALKGQFTQITAFNETTSLSIRGNPFWVGLDYSIFFKNLNYRLLTV